MPRKPDPQYARSVEALRRQGMTLLDAENAAFGDTYGGNQEEPQMTTDPVFETRAELEAWASASAHSAGSDPKLQLAVLGTIRRVTLAHAHLLSEPTAASSAGE